jgi:hypothetical protein
MQKQLLGTKESDHGFVHSQLPRSLLPFQLIWKEEQTANLAMTTL